MTVDTEYKQKNFLRKKVVYLRPIYREGKWENLSGTRRKDTFMFERVKRSYDLPKKMSNGQYPQVFDNEERVLTSQFPDTPLTEQGFFEKILGLPAGHLNAYSYEKTFWSSKDARVTTDKNGIKLDLSNPLDVLKYRILLANKDTISPNWEDREKRGSYEFALVDDEVVTEAERDKGELEDKANQRFFIIKDNTEELKRVLKAIGKPVAVATKPEFIYNEVKKIVKEDPRLFLDTLTHPYFEEKILIRDAVSAGALKKTGKNNYEIPGGQTLGTEIDACKFLKDPENIEVRKTVEYRIENSKK